MKYCFFIWVVFFLQSALHAQTPGTLKWKFETGGEVGSSPALGSDGTIYVGSDDEYLYAINPDGTEKWKFSTRGIALYSPAIGNDGTIYIGCFSGNLYAINPDGTLKWQYYAGNSIHPTAALRLDGTIYVGNSDGYLDALNEDGILRWRFKTGGWINSSPAIGEDGTIYFGSKDRYTYAIHPDGTLKWKLHCGDEVFSSPAIGSDGTIYIGSGDENLYAINPDGTIKWKFKTTASVHPSPTVGSDGTIYVGDYNLYAINPDGTQKWKFEINQYNEPSPAIGADGTLYFGSNDEYIYALNPNGTTKWRYKAGGALQSSPAIGTDGTIYIGGEDNFLYAINCSNTDYAESPWPKFHKNNLNGGSSESALKCQNKFLAFTADMNEPASFNIDFYNNLNAGIELSEITLNHENYQVDYNLPYFIDTSVTNFSIPVTMLNPVSELHELGYQISYTINGNPGFFSNSISVASIVDDNSELSVIGKRAIDAYHSSLDSNMIATLNNRGVIYRLLGYYDLAKADFDQSVDMALNHFYGFAGIKMNQGVVQSDLSESTWAKQIYHSALEDVSDDNENSSLAPHIYYNQAWELYHEDDFQGAETLAWQIIAHSYANNWIKAKAYALLGAIMYAQGDIDGSDEAFQLALDLDPDGPIGKMAAENMKLITASDEVTIRSEIYVYPQPASDYLLIEYTGTSFQESSIELFNALGQMIYSEKLHPSGTGFIHSIETGTFPQGVYLLYLNIGLQKKMKKIVIH